MIKILFIIILCLTTESCSLKKYLTKPSDKEENKKLDVKEIVLNNDCTIIRDNWGVPHIYGKSDADAAFGLAYAQAEDDFFTVQETVLKSRGKYSSVYGAGKNKINGIFDYMVGLLKIWDIVDKQYSMLDQETIKLCEGYAQGLNKFIEDQNDSFIQHIYPVSGKDIVAGTIHKTPFFFQLPFFLADLYEKKPEDVPSHYTIGESLEFIKRAEGSNVYAVSPNASDNGDTFLAINSHQPWDGELAWYEAHIHSEEGLNMVGGLFPGSTSITTMS